MPDEIYVEPIRQIFHNQGLPVRTKIHSILEAAVRSLPVSCITLYAREWRQAYCAFGPECEYALYHSVGVRDRPPMHGPLAPAATRRRVARGRANLRIPDLEAHDRRVDRGEIKGQPKFLDDPHGFARREDIRGLVRYRLGSEEDPVGVVFFNCRHGDPGDLGSRVLLARLKEVADYVGFLLRSSGGPESEDIIELLLVNKHIAEFSAEIAAMDCVGDEAGVFDSILRAARRICGDTEALVTMHTIREEDGGRWLCLSNEDPRGIVRQEHKSLPVPAPSEDGSGVVVWVAETGRAVFIENLLTVPEHWRRRFIELKPGVRSEIAVPLYSPDRNRVAGVLNVETPVIGSLTSEKTYYLMAFAQQAERTLEQARRVRQRERELADIARAVGHLRRPQAAEGDGATQPLDELCSRICSISGSWAADIWVRDLDGNRAVNVGRCNIDFGQEDCPRPDGRTVWLLKRPDDCSLIMRFRDDDPRRVDRPQSRKLVRARGGAGWHQEPFPEEDDLNQQNPAAVAHAIRQEVAVPLTYGSERLAVLFVKFRELVPLNDPRLRKLLLLADLAAIALGTREPGRQSEAAGQSGGR